MPIHPRKLYALMALTQLLAAAACGDDGPKKRGRGDAGSQDGGSSSQSDAGSQSGTDAGSNGDGDTAGDGDTSGDGDSPGDGDAKEDGGTSGDGDSSVPFSFADIGKPCTQASECVGGACRPEATHGYPGGFCTTKCSEEARRNFETDQSCGANAHCQIDGWSDHVCMPACEDSSECREGYRCEPFRKGSKVGVCYPAFEVTPPPLPPKDLEEPCTKDDDCEQVCLTEQSWGLPGGMCSASCNQDSDCGPNSACAYWGPEGATQRLCMKHCGSSADCREFYYCNQDDPTWTSCNPGSYIGGHVFVGAGLTVTVQDPIGGSRTFTASQDFELPNLFPLGSEFHVTATLQGNPAGVVCDVRNGDGGISSDGIRYGGVSVVCGKQAVFTKGGTTKWTVPEGVTSVSVVVVGAGGRASGPFGGGGGELCYAE